MRRLLSILFVITLFMMPSSALAQEYYFQNPQKIVHVYWNEDGTQSLNYGLTFQNDPSGHAIEFVDLGMPNSDYELDSITATVNGRSVTYMSSSEFQGNGSGIAFGLEGGSIPPGEGGEFLVNIGRINRVLYPDDDDQEYVSAVFAPAYFDSSVVYGSTDITVVFHLPPNVRRDEPRWHSAPGGFPEQPETGFDEQGRITYTWRNPSASPDTSYSFGASFPAKYVPAESVVSEDAFTRWLNTVNFENLIPFGCIGIFALWIGWGIFADQKRRLKYLPPKITMEGQGIKRGLTAVEAAILLEQPLDKVMTMILFAVIKKNAARVAKREPLGLEFSNPEPDNLQTYEKDFLKAFHSVGKERQGDLQTMMVELVKTVANKMRGFSASETKTYYHSIIQKAWQQVEAADTPEVRSQKYDEVMEWTMMDRNYGDRTRDIFRGQPVFVPRWWGGYDPVFRQSTDGRIQGTSSGGAGTTTGGGLSLPHLPGSDFAASIVNGVQTFSGNVVGNLTDFTRGVTQKTNPVPISRSSSSGGRGRSSGGGCACACACAGCACACAGGGR